MPDPLLQFLASPAGALVLAALGAGVPAMVAVALRERRRARPLAEAFGGRIALRGDVVLRHADRRIRLARVPAGRGGGTVAIVETRARRALWVGNLRAPAHRHVGPLRWPTAVADGPRGALRVGAKDRRVLARAIAAVAAHDPGPLFEAPDAAVRIAPHLVVTRRGLARRFRAVCFGLPPGVWQDPAGLRPYLDPLVGLVAAMEEVAGVRGAPPGRAAE